MIDWTVAHLNVERYQKLLRTELDETKRLMVAQLLAEEEVKLAAFRSMAEKPAQRRTAELGTRESG